MSTGVLRISIVTPSYNQARFVAETIESVLSQAGDFEIEYAVMDGGSTDGSVEIIRRYAELVAAGRWPVRCRGAAMTWVSERDAGQTAAINEGLRCATGDVFAYINSDDLYAPGAFQHVVDAFEEHPAADIVYGDGDVVDAEGGLQWEWLSRPYNHAVMTSYHFLWNDFTNYIMQQSTFWRRRVRDRIGEFDPTFHYAMDAEYWIRAGAAGLRLVHLPRKLGKFRMIQGTKSLSSPTVFWEDYLEIFRRYRGSGRLGDFFAFFYYNLARQFGGDLPRAIKEGAQVFERWRDLPERERDLLRADARGGRALARVLVARDLQRAGGDVHTAAVLREALAERPGLIIRPAVLGLLLRRTLGRRAAAIDRWVTRAVERYRLIRFDYRYARGR